MSASSLVFASRILAISLFRDKSRSNLFLKSSSSTSRFWRFFSNSSKAFLVAPMIGNIEIEEIDTICKSPQKVSPPQYFLFVKDNLTNGK